MGKDKKAKSKAPFANAEEAKAKIEGFKETIETAKNERKEFAKANGLSMKSENFDANSKDKKHGKKWDAMTKVIEDARKGKETAETWLKENKPKKDSAPRETKYEYPAGMSDAEKKKFRATQRAAAAKAEKDEKTEGKKKDSKKAAKEEPKAEGKKKTSAQPKEEAPAADSKKKKKAAAPKKED